MKKRMEKTREAAAKRTIRASDFTPVFEGNTVRFVARVEEEVKQFKTIPTLIKKVSKVGLTRSMASSIVASFLMILLISTPLMLAFEAHVINVTATVIQIDPPVILPPSGGQCLNNVQVSIDDADVDAANIYYTITPGSDPTLAPDPVCGGPLGGPKPIGPLPVLTQNSVVKAIACDATNTHHSTVSVQIYDVACFGTIEGHKYNDLNQNEAIDPQNGDQPVQGWRVDLYFNNVIAQTTMTDVNGFYEFNNLLPGTYMVQEEDRPSWIHVSAASTTVVLAANQTQNADFLNFDSGSQCLPQDTIFPPSLAVQAAGNTSGNDNIAVDQNVTINGSVRSNEKLRRIGSSSISRTITGNAVVGSTVDAGFLISSGVIGAAPAVSLPNVDIPTWEAKAQLGGTVNGSFVFPDSTTGLSLGPTEILGNLVFGQNDTANIKGPLYIHGNLTLGTSTTLTEDSNFGNEFVTIIVDGTVTINPGANFVKSGTRGAFLVVSNHSAVSGFGAAINILADSSNVGDALLYTPTGDIHIGASRSILAAFGVHGTGADGTPDAAVRIDNGAVVAYRNLPTQISCGPLQPFQQTLHVVINEFMPNPSVLGGKIGALGLPLDGEWVELYNPTSNPVDVKNYVLYDHTLVNVLPITNANSSTGSTVIPSLGRIVIYREGNPNFSLQVTGGDTVNLYSNLIGSGGSLIDSHTYTANAPVDKSFARIPDGTANWVDPDATPGTPNAMFFVPLGSMPDGTDLSSSDDLPTITIPSPFVTDIPVAELPDNDTPPTPFPGQDASTTVIVTTGNGGASINIQSSTTVDESTTTTVNTGDSTTSTTTDVTTGDASSTTVIVNVASTTSSGTDGSDSGSSTPPTPPTVPPSQVIQTPVKVEDPQPPTDTSQPPADVPPPPPTPPTPPAPGITPPSAPDAPSVPSQ